MADPSAPFTPPAATIAAPRQRLPTPHLDSGCLRRIGEYPNRHPGENRGPSLRAGR